MVPATPQNDLDTIELLRTFEKLPRLLEGKQVEITFSSFRFRGAAAEDCSALRLKIGATVYSQVELSDTGEATEYISVYAPAVSVHRARRLRGRHAAARQRA